jgi:hypothetical protein
MKHKVAVVRTLKQARAYVSEVGICGIFSDAGVGMPNLWDVVDVPDQVAETAQTQGLVADPSVMACGFRGNDRLRSSWNIR